MKKFFSIIVLITAVFVSCKKNEKDVVGTWDEASHLINEQDFTVSSRSITFLDNGAYSTNSFTYPWHCEPGAAVSDNGTWEYNASDKIITLTSTKAQESHSNNILSANVTSFSGNQMVWEFTSPSCSSQNVVLTLQR